MNALSKFAKILLLVFACLHLLFAVGFAIKTPYRQAGYLFSQKDPKTGFFAKAPDIGAPDERQHANYVRTLLKDHQLPVFQPGSPNFGDEYQSHQPPLYYVSAALAATVTGQTDVESQSFGKVLRVFNALVGASGIVGIFFAAFWSSKREDVAILAAGFAAVLPMNCALSGAISNDPLLITLVAWSFAFCAKAYLEEEGSNAKKSLMIAAVFTGLACATKSSGLVAMIGFVVTAFLMRQRIPIKNMAPALGVAILIALPIWTRNQILYGDPLAQRAFKEAFTGSAQKSNIVSEIELSGAPGSPEVNYWINWFGYWVARSFIGTFGYMDIWLNSSSRAARSTDPNTLYKFLIAFIAIAKLSFLVGLRRSWKDTPKPVLIGLLMAIVTFMLLVGFNLTYFQAQGRYLMPALGPLSLMFAIGWLSLFRSKLIPVLLTVLVLFGGTTIYSLARLEPEFSDRISGTVSPR
jgi:4-amino-4-deoxy-L-arabinose transferase-like glycosyltransferase